MRPHQLGLEFVIMHNYEYWDATNCMRIQYTLSNVSLVLEHEENAFNILGKGNHETVPLNVSKNIKLYFSALDYLLVKYQLQRVVVSTLNILSPVGI